MTEQHDLKKELQIKKSNKINCCTYTKIKLSKLNQTSYGHFGIIN